MNQTARVSTGRPTLVLNAASQPLGAIPLSRAVALTMTGRATTLASDGELHSPSLTIPAPTVIVRTEWVAPPTGVLTRVTKAALFARDRWSCAWCGRSVEDGTLRLAELSIDHVVPIARFRKPGDRRRRIPEAHTWENVVTSCLTCNHDKADTDPDWDALGFRPEAPAKIVVISRLLAKVGRGAWDPYLPAAA